MPREMEYKSRKEINIKSIMILWTIMLLIGILYFILFGVLFDFALWIAINVWGFVILFAVYIEKLKRDKPGNRVN